MNHLTTLGTFGVQTLGAETLGVPIPCSKLWGLFILTFHYCLKTIQTILKVTWCMQMLADIWSQQHPHHSTVIGGWIGKSTIDWVSASNKFQSGSFNQIRFVLLMTKCDMKGRDDSSADKKSSLAVTTCGARITNYEADGGRFCRSKQPGMLFLFGLCFILPQLPGQIEWYRQKMWN